jgi:hypothetical protein
VSTNHAATVATLLARHRDLFDSIIVAQAMHEPLRLMTRGPVVKRYHGDAIFCSPRRRTAGQAPAPPLTATFTGWTQTPSEADSIGLNHQHLCITV